MLNIFQYICEATGAVLATGALSEIFDGIKENVDACVFQNGHIDYDKLDAESFDRDMPIKFDKLRMKLEAAAGRSTTRRSLSSSPRMAGRLFLVQDVYCANR